MKNLIKKLTGSASKAPVTPQEFCLLLLTPEARSKDRKRRIREELKETSGIMAPSFPQRFRGTRIEREKEETKKTI